MSGGDELLRAGRLRAAAVAYRRELDALAPDCPQRSIVRHRLAWALLRTGRTSAALALYEEARVPFDHHTWRMLGHLYAETGRLADAEDCYRTLLSWIVAQVVAQYAAMRVLGRLLHSGLSRGACLAALEPLRAGLYRRGALWRRRTLGLPMLWSLLADVYDRLGRDGAAARCREDFRRYWAWFAGPDHPGVLALANDNGGVSHA